MSVIQWLGLAGVLPFMCFTSPPYGGFQRGHRLSHPNPIVVDFAINRWKLDLPPDKLVRLGNKRKVDDKLGKFHEFPINWGQQGPKPSNGRRVNPDEDDEIVYYRDRRGTRLVQYLDEEGPDQPILSAECKHRATLISLDLSDLKTPSGLRLGDSANRLRSVLGRPTLHYRFRTYTILLYIQKPEYSRLEGKSYPSANAAAYVTERDRLVEIGIFFLSLEPRPH